jgi:hypothetical protein
MFRHITTKLVASGNMLHDRQPVRRHSRLVGECEGAIWRRTDRAEVRRILLAARRYELTTRAPGRRNGPLGHVALEVLELLGNLVAYKSGRLEPSIDTIARKVRRARSAVVEALAALRAHGFLDWLCRYEPTGCEGRGPQVRQVSNAYRLALPPRAARLLGIQGQDVPLPDDLEHAKWVRAEDVLSMKAGLPLDELAVVEVDDGPLARALAGLGRLVQERESARRSEIQTKNFI